MTGLYLHIPYCASKCNYCDFYSAGGSHGVPEIYLDALLRELTRFVKNGAVSTFDTLYFGGGTPSLLTPTQVKRLIDAVSLVPNAEITLEANPETVTQKLLYDFRAAGVNRISFGVQTAFDASLKRLGRRHTAQQSRDAMRFARQAGFENISGDVMLALPDYTLAELTATLDLLEQGGCTHISSYLLKIEPKTVFGKHPPAHLPDADAAADFYLAAVEMLTARGYAQFEISNFAKPHFEGRHNLLYWNCENYLGLGAAAHSSLAGKRFSAPVGTSAFLAAPVIYEPQGAVTAEDYIMLQLRLASGLSLPKLRAEYGTVFSEKQQKFLQTICENGMAELENEILKLTPKGMLLQNSILCELI
ncbi:MAG: radical SAM family heme chaperone HemW [Ruthenibacterium sp.]